MGPLSYRLLTARYAVATTFLLLIAAGDAVTALLGPRQAAAVRLWASTNVINLHHHPIPALVLSAFLVSQSPVAWLVLIAFTMFGANSALGNLRLVLVCAAGQVIGTAVSEGIVAYRINHGALASPFAHILDIGPSYVVVAAIGAAAVFGSWPARASAVTVFATLVFVGHIFAGLTSLNVAAVGHLTAIVTGIVLAVALLRDPVLARADAIHGDRRTAPWAIPARNWEFRTIGVRGVPGSWSPGRRGGLQGQYSGPAVVPQAIPALAEPSQDAMTASQDQPAGDLPS